MFWIEARTGSALNRSFVISKVSRKRRSNMSMFYGSSRDRDRDSDSDDEFTLTRGASNLGERGRLHDSTSLDILGT